MANNLSAFTPIKFSNKLIQKLWNETIYNQITNTNYEGEIKQAGDRVRVRTEADIALSDYTKGMTLVTQDLAPTYEELVVNKQKYFKFIVDDIDKFQNDIATIDVEAANARKQISKVIDVDVLSAYKEVDGDHAIGTAYATGTVAVAATTGVVTGSGTTFTAAMVGTPFKATGQTSWYTINAYTSATSITIEDQATPGTYSGGAISASTAYNIPAASPITLTKSNIYGYIVQLGTTLDTSLASMNGGDRWMVANAKLKGLLMQAPELIPAIATAYEDVVKKRMIGEISGFRVYQTELVNGDNTNGYFFLAGDNQFISFAMQILKVNVINSDADPNSFVSTCKGLVTWGWNVFAGNRGRGAFLRGII